MTNFSDILNKPMDEIEAPVPLPIGTYLCIVDGVPTVGELGKNKNPAATFNLKFMQAQPDVDHAALMDALKGKALSDRSIRHTLWMTPDALWRLKQFLREHLQIDARTVSAALAEAQGRQVMVSVGHRASDDGSQIYLDVKSTAKV